MRYRVLEDIGGRRKFAVILDPGEEVIGALGQFADQLMIEGASVTGIGALSRVRLGWFNPATKEFRENRVDDQSEVLAITGNIAVGADEDAHDHPHSHAHLASDGRKVALHMHIVLGCADAQVRGGHLVAGWVSPTMELVVEEAAHHLTRGLDAVTGLVLLEPRHPCPHSMSTQPAEAAE